MNSVCDYTAISLVNLGVPAPHQLILCKPEKDKDEHGGPRGAPGAPAEQLRARGARGASGAQRGPRARDVGRHRAGRRPPPSVGNGGVEMMGVRSGMYLFVNPRDWIDQVSAVVQTVAHQTIPTILCPCPT